MSSTYLDVDLQLLKHLNMRNALTLTPRDVEFVSPVPAEQVNAEMAKTYNTAISAKMLTNDVYDGGATIFYNRLNLTREFASARFTDRSFMFVNRPATLHGILDHVNRKTGLKLTPDNVYDVSLDPLQDFSIVTIRAKPESKDYVGSFDMGIVNVGATQIVGSPDTDVWAEWDKYRKSTAGGSSERYSAIRIYGIDYSAAAGMLKRVKVPRRRFHETWALDSFSIIDDSLSRALGAIDGMSWPGVRASGSFSTYCALPIYNGPTADCKIGTAGWRNAFGEHVGTSDGHLSDTFNPCNLDFTHALVLYMEWPLYQPEVYRSGLVIHYNLER